ncbi:MAG: hypothetical protein ACLFVI_07680 [Archaeoglobaceae archaeon]
MPETTDKKIDVLLKLSMHKARSFELYNFLSNFVDKQQKKEQEQERKQLNTKELRKKIAKKIPYEEKISTEVSGLREERF